MSTEKNISYIQNAQGSIAKSMSSREIATLTGSKHDSVLKTIRALAERGVVFGNETPYTHPQNGQTYMEFRLDYRNTMVVVSGYSAELRAKIIDRWQELESAQPAPRELSRMDLIKLAMEAEQERLLLAAKVEEMEPTVAAYDRLTNAENTVTMTDAAKQLKIKPSQLREWMVTHKWIYKLGGAKAWTAHQDRIDSGCMMHKTTTVERDGETSIYSQARVTAKGLATISKAIEKARKTAMIVGVAA